MTAASVCGERPRVSVLMTIYNAEIFLKEAIDSLLKQSFLNWELVAINNGSIDHSAEILSAYDDPRIRLFSLPENIGRTPGLRCAFEQAKGGYIAVLDADDIALPERLARQVEYLDNHDDVVLVGTWTEVIDEEGRITSTLEPSTNSEEIHDCLGWATPMAHSSVMFRRDVASKVGGYPEEFSYAQDMALFQAMSRIGRLAIIDDFLCQWRTSSESFTRSKQNRLLIANEQLLLFRFAREHLPLSARSLCINRLAIARAEVRYGLAKFEKGDLFSGLKSILRGLLRSPTLVWENDRIRRYFGLQQEVYWWKQ